MHYQIAIGLLALLCGCGHLNRSDPADTSLLRGAGAEASRGARGTLRIASYNVHGQAARAIYRALRGDRRLARADVLFLQEIEIAGEDTPRELAELLGWSYVYAPGYGVGDRGSHGVAIISRFAISAPEVIELPRHDVVFNSARRVALAATIRLDGRPVRVYSVHLDNRLNPAERVAQLAPVLKDAAAATGPVVIAGDMNTSPFCWLEHVVPVPCGLQDNRLEAAVRRHGLDTPVRDSGGTSKWLAMRLDAIYTRDLQVTDFGVGDMVRVSDHLPLWAHVRLPARVDADGARLRQGASARCASARCQPILKVHQ